MKLYGSYNGYLNARRAAMEQPPVCQHCGRVLSAGGEKPHLFSTGWGHTGCEHAARALALAQTVQFA